MGVLWQLKSDLKIHLVLLKNGNLMAHYAFLDENNVVVNVIVGKDEGDYDWEQYYGNVEGKRCKRTSYNTDSNTHPYGTPFRKNYACVGGIYDEDRDAFIPPVLFPSWVLNEETCLWEPPIPYPDDGQYYEWDEETISWGEPLDT